MDRPALTRAARTGVADHQVLPTVEAYRRLYDEARGGDVDARKTSANQLSNQFYDLVTDFYEYGWGHAFHFGVRHRGEPLEASLRRHEYHLALRLGLRPGQRVLDVGCGVGGPMRNIARFSGARVVGLNQNAYQLDRAARHVAAERLTQRCELVQGDFLQMPLPDASFDAAYEIEATCHAPDRVVAFSEVYRVLKPGALFAGYEWVLTDAFDPADPDHVRVKRAVEEGNALPDLQPAAEVDRALAQSDFEVLEARDLAPESDPETPWYLPLTGREATLRGLPRTRYGRALTHAAVRALERVRLAPAGATEVSQVLNRAADALVEAGERAIFTPMYFFLCRKPG